MSDALLVLNAGSSSLKCAAFVRTHDRLELLFHVLLEELFTQPRFRAKDPQGNILEEHNLQSPSGGHAGAMEFLLTWAEASSLRSHRLLAAGHRVVHGGIDFTAPVRIDDQILSRLEQLVPLAPLHQPHNLSAIRALAQHRPDLPQVACFDTAFHRTQSDIAQMFALPRRLTADGVRRYGFHGLSYEYIASILPQHDAQAAAGRTIVAHLGNGVSLCAMQACRSIATTMSFTPLDGLVMGTRCGALDPGVLLYLMDRYHMDARGLERVLYYQSGLLGISGVSSDMRTLLESTDPHAREAIDLFVYRIGREIGSLTAALGGLDGVVFTAGIGEHAAAIRARVCQDAAWLGLELDEEANVSHQTRISRAHSRVSAWVLPTDEERIIAQHTWRMLC